MKFYVNPTKIINTLILFTCSHLILFSTISAQIADGQITEEVSFNNGEIKLTGTLTLPSIEGPYSAVVFISGSGPQNRDGETRTIPDYRPYKVIAEHLAKKGIATLRYDDRGVGNSSGDYIQAQESDFIGDAQQAFRYLLSDPRIDSQNIGLIGHSEGAAIAANVASNNPNVAFVISLAGGAVEGKNLLLQQAERQAMAEGMKPDKIADVLQEQNQIFDLVIDQDWDKLTELVIAVTIKRLEAVPEEQKAAIGDLTEFAKSRAKRSIITFQHPRYQYLLNHDFGVDWKHINVPVLALFGELDVQCDASQNKEAFIRILSDSGNNNLTVVVIDSANHLFQKANTGSMREYSILPKSFAPGFLVSLSNWLEHVTYVEE